MLNPRALVACITAGVCASSLHVFGEGSVVVRTRPGIEPAHLRAAELPPFAMDGNGFEPVLDFEVGDPALASRLGLDRYYRLRVVQEGEIDQIIDALEAREDLFEVVEREHYGSIADVIPNDPSFHRQWSLRNIGQGPGCPAANASPTSRGRSTGDISLTRAWTRTTGHSETIVAILDSGVTPHVDLPPLLPGWAHDGLSTNDQCNHGTHVAGIVAARADNGIGIAGVLWDARILPVRVLSGCGGTDINYGRGLIWAADRAHIANSSLQYYQVGSFFTIAVEYARAQGLIMVAATGNHGPVVANPARLPGVIAVGATNHMDTIATFSNKGPEVDLAAPGVSIYSLTTASTLNGVATSTGCFSGTSMASPHVAGAAGLITAIDANATPGRVTRILVTTADDRGPPAWDSGYGWGRLNAFDATTLAMCYVDCNMDGQLDVDDIICFVDRFAAQHPYADLDDDGEFTSDDVLLFLEEYQAGCSQ